MELVKNIAIIFMSIFFESLPFLLLGSLISSIIERYVSNETMAKLIPKNIVLGSFMGIFLGFFLPACDCAVIPVSKRLIKKKVPLNVAISFMLASPIINPVVLLSTYSAFYKTNPQIFWLRLILGIVIAFVVGIIMGILFKREVTINNNDDDDHCCCCHHEHHHSHTCECHHDHDEEIGEDFRDLIEDVSDISEEEIESKLEKHCLKNDILFIFRHTAYDMFEVVKYLMFGAIIASLVQILLPRNILLMFNENKVLAIITLMLFAYLISLCSTSDSFVGKSLLNSFGIAPIMGYLLLGPMIDIKNTIVLFGNYKKSFVVTLISLIFITIFVVCLFLGGVL